MDDVQIIGAVQRVNDLLAAAGVQAQSRYENGVMYYRYLVPLRDGRMLAFESAVEPQFEIGAGNIARKIKKGLKKVAKSKAFGKLLKFGASVASIVPGGQALGMGLSIASKVQDAARKKATKKKSPAAVASPVSWGSASQLVQMPSGKTARVVWA